MRIPFRSGCWKFSFRFFSIWRQFLLSSFSKAGFKPVSVDLVFLLQWLEKNLFDKKLLNKVSKISTNRIKIRNKNENIQTGIIFTPGSKSWLYFQIVIVFSLKSRQNLRRQRQIDRFPEDQNSFLAFRRSDQPLASSISQNIETVRTG